MARMYPEVFPGSWDPANPEFQVYQILKCLPELYHVFYSKRINGGLFGKAECEIDFIVFNGRDIVVCLEVKGGVISYDGTQRRWLQNGHVCKDIIKQATDGAHTLARAVERETRNACIDWALCFPDCCLSNHAGAFEVHPNQILDEKSLLDVTSAVERLESHIRGKYGYRAGLNANENRALVDRLTRSIGFVQVLGVRIAREAEQIVQVTNEQLEVLTDLTANHCMLVHGGAGTGKTIIAQTFAKQLAENGSKVILLFFNRGIASKVRRAFNRDGNVLVSTFSSFAKRKIEEEDPTWWESHKAKEDDFWHTQVPLRLLDIPQERLPQFDAVLVDEGQDFKPEWLEFLQRLIRPGGDTHYAVLLDEKQDIFGHWKEFPCKPTPAKKVLTKNCRNTRAIVGFLNKNYATGMTSFERSPVGTEVVERDVVDDKEELEWITKDVRQLTSKEGITPGSIVIMLNAPKDESVLRGISKIDKFSLRSTYERFDPSSQHVYYSTIEIFKGLEADVVLLSLGDQIPENEFFRLLYVEASRAKHLLYVYRRRLLGA